MSVVEFERDVVRRFIESRPLREMIGCVLDQVAHEQRERVDELAWCPRLFGERAAVTISPVTCLVSLFDDL